jgi:hypothetical protein
MWKIASKALTSSMALVVFVLFVAGALQSPACAQARGAANPQAPPPIPGQNPNGMRIYLWAGPKTHGPGQHDYAQFLADWYNLLTARGAIVDGALHGPTSADLERTDVIVIYKGDAGYLTDAQKATLEAYVRRGGGIVVLHDSGCGPDPAYFSTLIGGAKKHGEINFTLEAPVPYTVVATDDPIMKDHVGLHAVGRGVFPDHLGEKPPSKCWRPR